VTVAALWPDPGFVHTDENNHSIVLALTLNKVSFVLTGDATADVWPQIVPRLPARTKVFQVPHHGALNGTFDRGGTTPWVTHFAAGTAPGRFAVSCHPEPYGHPHVNVVTALSGRFTRPHGRSVIHRTDLDYQIRFETDGSKVRSYYTHE